MELFIDRIENLKFFIRLVEKGGVAAAGKDFGLSPATASDRLAKLELDYGAKLVNRTTRSLSLTDEGRILFEGARSLVDDANDLENQIRLGMNRVSGPIRMAAPQDLGTGRIGPLLAIFMDQHPGIKIELILDDQYQDLVASGIDLAVRLGSIKDSSLRIRKLADNRRLVVASPLYLETHSVPTHPNDLADHNCLIMHWGRTIDREWSFKVNGRRKTIAVTGDRASNNGVQVKHWCLAGHGLAYKSIWDVKTHLKSGELVELLSDYQIDQNSAVQLLYPGGGKPPRRIRALIDYLVEHFETGDLDL